MSSDICSLAVIGDGAVGKTSIINTFRSDGFGKSYKQTVGVDFFEKLLNIKGDKYVSLRVWDIGGQSINSKNLQKYLASSQIIFLVYDVTNIESFNNLEDWLRMARRCSKASFIYVVGNKVDLIESRQVTEDQQSRFVRISNLSGGIYMSAKSGENVLKTFYRAASDATGVKLYDYELAVHDKVIKAYVQKDNSDEGRTAFADEIEAQDREAEMRKQQSAEKGCCAIS